MNNVIPELYPGEAIAPVLATEPLRAALALKVKDMAKGGLATVLWCPACGEPAECDDLWCTDCGDPLPSVAAAEGHGEPA